MEHKKTDLDQMTKAAMLAALTAVLSQISLPMPSGVPATLQTFGAALCGYLLGKKWGSVSIIVYIMLGAAGAPVFSAFHGGFSSITGITGGFIWGFLPMAFLCGLGAEHKGKILPVLFGTAGLILLHLCGVMQFSMIKGSGFWTAALAVSVPFLLKDMLSVVFAYSLSIAVRSRISVNGKQESR